MAVSCERIEEEGEPRKAGKLVCGTPVHDTEIPPNDFAKELGAKNSSTENNTD